MMEDQLVPALLAALLGQGVRPAQIEDAISAVRDVPLGASIAALAGDGHATPLARAFVFEQTDLLKRARQ